MRTQEKTYRKAGETWKTEANKGGEEWREKEIHPQKKIRGRNMNAHPAEKARISGMIVAVKR